ncbi:MAG: uroporphyrinogen-III synthase [Myxococcales bacterium]|nr:uroporphyrinogen-III synthase [Myxococcales bacterium]
MSSVQRRLDGLRVLVTRASDPSRRLASALEEHGATPLELQLLEVREGDAVALRAACQSAPWDLVVFASANAVAAVARCAGDRASLHGLARRVAVVGTATARECRDVGLNVDIVAPTFVAESLVDALLADGVDGCRVLLPRAAETRDVVAPALRGAGADVTEVVAYRVEPVMGAAASLAELAATGFDVVTVTSSRTAEALDAAAAASSAVLARLRATPWVAIGPICAETARALGYPVAAVAAPSTIDALVAALVERFGVPE